MADGADAFKREFEVVWQAYPRRAANPRGKALKAYIARRKAGVSAEELLAGVRAYAGYIARERVAPRFVKHGQRFFGPDEEWRAELYAPVEGSAISPGQRVLQMLEDMGHDDRVVRAVARHACTSPCHRFETPAFIGMRPMFSRNHITGCAHHHATSRQPRSSATSVAARYPVARCVAP